MNRENFFDEKALNKLIIAELKQYRILKVQLENIQERERAGIVDLFPSVRETGDTSYLKVLQIQRALEESLDPLERELIEKKYLGQRDPTDLEVYLELGIKKAKYYAKKKDALKALATALGVI
ncbi:ArpU family phage packaging/lysis transcriptional regulator [Peribacillus sp. SCS-37]|uniref:ArpU family phage packaging/lysis transcriptional regulator n=1 Tax=Paraperibacillus esterisolvens TaxID=3115296 RepID=UPI0039065958